MLHCEEHPAMTIDKKMQLDAVNDCALITWRILVTRDQATKKSIEVSPRLPQAATRTASLRLAMHT